MKTELSTTGVPGVADTGHVPDPVLSEEAGAVSRGQEPARAPRPVQPCKVRGVDVELDGVAGDQEVRVDGKQLRSLPGLRTPRLPVYFQGGRQQQLQEFLPSLDRREGESLSPGSLTTCSNLCRDIRLCRHSTTVGQDLSE